MTTYLAYAQTGREFEVAEALTEDGFDVWVAREIAFIRRGKKRRPDPVERPILPNYIFLSLSDDEWHALNRHRPKYMAGTMHALRRDDERELNSFRDKADARYAEGQRIARSNDAAQIAEYRHGQKLIDVTGRFGEVCLTFRRIVETAHDLHPKIEAEMEMLGRMVRVQLDPLDVKAAS